MINYKQILEDKAIINHFEKLPLHSDNPFNHGLKHAENVSEIMKKLIQLLDIKKPESEYLLIACVLHDVGQVYGSDNHYIKGIEFARSYLESKIDLAWLNKILFAIETHHQKENLSKLPLFNHLVLFADKMDFTCKRLNDYDGQAYEKHILDVNFEIKDNEFMVIITTDKNISEYEFLNNYEYSTKIIERIRQFANKLDLGYKILLDNKKIEA